MYHILKIAKWPSEAIIHFFKVFFYFDRHTSFVIMKQWAMTAHQVQTGTFRKITEQLQMVMTVTHPVSLCLFHPQSLLNHPLFSPFLSRLWHWQLEVASPEEQSLFNEAWAFPEPPWEMCQTDVKWLKLMSFASSNRPQINTSFGLIVAKSVFNCNTFVSKLNLSCLLLQILKII